MGIVRGIRGVITPEGIEIGIVRGKRLIPPNDKKY